MVLYGVAARNSTIGLSGSIQTSGCLRSNLKRATSGAHDRLDNAMRSASGWTSHHEYARFLSLQYSARVPVENWLNANAPAALRAPAQSPLIADDLRELGVALPDPATQTGFTIPQSSPASALGAAWVLAGSSLGNRAILKDLERAGHQSWPSAFLSNPGMLVFWKRLRPMIDEAATPETLSEATAAAIAVFDHFIAQTATVPDLAPSRTVAAA